MVVEVALHLVDAELAKVARLGVVEVARQVGAARVVLADGGEWRSRYGLII